MPSAFAQNLMNVQLSAHDSGQLSGFFNSLAFMTPFGSTHAHWLSSRQLSANQLFDAIAPLGACTM